MSPDSDMDTRVSVLLVDHWGEDERSTYQVLWDAGLDVVERRPAQPPDTDNGAEALGNDKGEVYAALRRVESILDEAVLSGALTAAERRLVTLSQREV